MSTKQIKRKIERKQENRKKILDLKREIIKLEIENIFNDIRIIENFSRSLQIINKIYEN